MNSGMTPVTLSKYLPKWGRPSEDASVSDACSLAQALTVATFRGTKESAKAGSLKKIPLFEEEPRILFNHATIFLFLFSRLLLTAATSDCNLCKDKANMR